MAKPLRPIVRSGGFYPSRKYTPLVYPGGYTTLNAKNGKPDPLNTISGSIVRFISNHVKPFVKTVVNIDPVQDLHGYDNPWPAGGGKNKLDTSVTPTNIDVYGSSGSKLSQQHPGWTVYLPSGTYTISYLDTTVVQYIRMNVVNADDSFVSWNTITTTTVESPRTVTLSDGQYIKIFLASGSGSLMVGKKIQIEAGSSSTSYAPYSNLCPISGWTGANVTRTGINIWDEEWEVGDLNTSTGGNSTNNNRIRSKNYIPIKGGESYSFAGFSNLIYVKRCYYDAQKQFLRGESTRNKDINPDEDVYYVRFALDSNYGSTYNHDISINYPSTGTTYHPYTGTTLPITFPDSAGTVYGGTLTVNEDGSGELTVKKICVDLASRSWTARGVGSVHKAYSSSLGASERSTYYNAAAIAENYKFVNFLSSIPTTGTAADNRELGVYLQGTSSQEYGGNIVWVTDVNDTATKPSGLMVYNLLTPVSYNLTAEEVGGILTTLKGENNVWADTGDIEVTVYGVPIVEPQADTLTSLNILLGGAYRNNHTQDDVPDDEALNILLGGADR